jgi:hypothetical protein
MNDMIRRGKGATAILRDDLQELTTPGISNEQFLNIIINMSRQIDEVQDVFTELYTLGVEAKYDRTQNGEIDNGE